MKKVVIFLFALFSLSSYVSAQDEASELKEVSDQAAPAGESEEPDQEGFKSNWFIGVGEGAVVNKFKDNWFVGIGPAYQVFSGTPSNGGMFDHSSMGLQLRGGKWMTPDFGFRFGFQGFSFKDYKKESQSYMSLDANMMVNVQNLFFGYSENRFWSIDPYMGPSFLISDFDKNTHYGFGLLAGLHNTFNMNNIIPYVGDKLYLYLDLSAIWSDKEFDHCEAEYVKDAKGNTKKVSSRGLDAIYAVSIGAVYRFPKRGWTSSFIMY
ncbi:MAG: hypothetical protein IK005_08915 [Paludibacteraceae bacterium]|nr:hypothetical protein [Paludibacteraceae bacterium]